MSIINTIYQTITTDPELELLLAKDPITNNVAIYETWAHESAEMPYIVQTHEQRRGNHFAKTDALAIFDIFTNQGTINAEVIRNELLTIFDQNSIESENGEAARFYYSRDQEITGDPENEITHWQIVFNVQYWRKAWLAYKETPIIAGELKGDIDSSSLSAAELAAIMKIASEIVSNAAATGALSIANEEAVFVDIVTAINSESNAVSSLSAMQPLSATLNSSSAIIDAQLDTQKGVFLSSDKANSLSVVNANANITKALESTIDSSTTIENDLAIVRTISAVNESNTAITSDLAAIRKVGAAIGSISDTSGVLSSIKQASINIDGISDASGALVAAPNPIPKTISNIGVWYDASQLQLANNDLVSTWQDSSGNNRHLIASGDDQPIFITNALNGNPVMNFNKKVMTVDFGTTISQPITIFVVVKTNIQEAASLFYFDGILNTTRIASYRHSGGRLDYFGGAARTTTFFSENNVYYIYSYVFNGVNSSFRANKTPYESGDVGTNSLNGLMLNSSYSGNIVTRLNANYAEFIMYEKALTATEINTIEDYLKEKYNI